MSATQYAAWSVTAGEQPTTAKWGILGQNDASFNTGVGFNDGIIAWRHLSSDVIPTGTIHPFAGANVPSASWLFCDGSAVSRNDYVGLFSAISTTYGTGDGALTFNVPNLRGRSIFGVDTTQTEFSQLGINGGQKIVQSHNHAIYDPGHNHGLNDPGHNHGVNDPGHSHNLTGRNDLGATTDSPGVQWAPQVDVRGGGIQGAGTGIGIALNGTNASINGAGTGISVNSTGGGSNNLNPYLTINFIIKT